MSLQVGSWTTCINPLDKIPHSFFRRTGRINDIQNICSMCWSQCLKMEGYHHAGSGPAAYIHHKSSDSKPERDSL